MQNERVRRVAEMEARMDLVQAAAEELERALENWEAARPALETLRVYYGSPFWREDYEADEAGKLPPELKRGVLSQDGLWDLLERAEELERALRDPETEETGK